MDQPKKSVDLGVFDGVHVSVRCSFCVILTKTEICNQTIDRNKLEGRLFRAVFSTHSNYCQTCTKFARMHISICRAVCIGIYLHCEYVFEYECEYEYEYISHRRKNKWEISPFSGKILRL